MEIGLQFTLHIYKRYTLQELLVLIRQSVDRFGFQQVWINDNLGFRQLYTALAALAASGVQANLGSSVTHPYARNPIDSAAAFASVAELLQGSANGRPRELGIGIARGASDVLGRLVNTSKPISMVRETMQFLRVLLDGGTVHFDDFPALAAYHHLQKGRTMQLGFRPPDGVRLPIYCGGNGPRIIEAAVPFCDGIIYGTQFKTYGDLGTLAESLDRVQSARGEQRERPFKRIAQINVSISRVEAQAQEFAKPFVAHVITGRSDEHLRQLGVEPAEVARLRAAFAGGASFHDVAPLVTSPMVEALFVVGTPEQCVAQLRPLIDRAVKHRFDQVYFAKLGPDLEEATDLIGRELLPEVR